jgi:hypothetical protein
MSQSTSSLPIRRGKTVKAQRACIYGVEGLGKTTLAANFPNPVFIDTEQGSDHLDVARFENTRDWAGIKSAVEQLTAKPGEFKTLIIDSIDWAEKFLAEDICRRSHKASIEEFGYGKGYTYLAEEFAGFLRSLDALRDRGMHIVLLGHCSIRKFEQPEAAGAYDRYELKLSKQVAPLAREWVDFLAFGNFFTRIAESDSGKKRGVGGKERVLYTSHTAAWDAKNRHGLEEKLPFDYAAIAHVFDASAAAPPVATTRTDGGDDAKLAVLFDGREDAINAFLVVRGEITAQQTWRDAKPEYKARVLAAPERFTQAVADHTAAQGGAQ